VCEFEFEVVVILNQLVGLIFSVIEEVGAEKLRVLNYATLNS